LPRDVDLAHIDDALKTEQGADGCRRHAVLAGAGLGDDPLLAHPLGKETLAERVVDLVRAGVREILPLQVNPRSAAEIGQVAREVQRRRAADIISRETIHHVLELGVAASVVVSGFQLVERRHQRLRRILAAELPKSATRVRYRPGSAHDGRGPRFRF
jgi:hypothetical protein